MNIKIDSKFEAVSCLLARCDHKSPTPCAFSGSHTFANRIADVVRLLEKPSF